VSPRSKTPKDQRYLLAVDNQQMAYKSKRIITEIILYSSTLTIIDLEIMLKLDKASLIVGNLLKHAKSHHQTSVFNSASVANINRKTRRLKNKENMLCNKFSCKHYTIVLIHLFSSDKQLSVSNKIFLTHDFHFVWWLSELQSTNIFVSDISALTQSFESFGIKESYFVQQKS